MRKSGIVVIGAWVMGAVVCAQERPRTPTQIVQIALEQNRELQAARQRVAEAQALQRQAAVHLSPSLEFEAASGRLLGTHGEQEFSAGYFQPIETSGKREKRVAVSASGVRLAEADLDARTRALVFDVKTRIAQWQAAEARRAAYGRLLVATEESSRLIQARVAEGDASALDGQLLAVEVVRVRAQGAAQNGRAGNALIDLRRVVGTSETLTVAAETPIERNLSVADLTARALTTRPDLRAARETEAEASAGIALARAEGAPDLTAFAKYTHRTSAFEGFSGVTSAGSLAPLFDRDNIISAGISIPLFGSHRSQGATDAATARAAAARLEREHLEASIPQEVDAAYQRWLSARETARLFGEGVMVGSQKNLDVMRQAYGLGELRLLDVLNEQRRFADTELGSIDAQLELAEATADLERVVGSDLP